MIQHHPTEVNPLGRSLATVSKWGHADTIGNMDLGAVGYNVRRLRKACGWTVRHLAALSDVSIATVSRIENGTITNQTEDQARAMADAFGVPFANLLAWPATEGSGGAGAGSAAPRTSSLVSAARRRALRRWGATEMADLDLEEDDVEAAASPSRSIDGPSGGRRPDSGRYWRVRVRGDCMGPDVRDGDEVFVDTKAELRDGMRVLAEVDGALHLKRLRSTASGWELAPENGEPAIPVTDEARILGWAFARMDRLV